MKKSAKTLALIALFVALITIGTFISIPIVPVAFTLQTLFVLLAGALLGGVNGMICVLIYIFMGLMGLPVFTGGGGFSYVLRPSFGFTIGFAFSALSMGLIMGKSKKPPVKRLILAISVSTLIIYAVGIAYYLAVQSFYFGNAVNIGYVLLYFWIIFIPSDILKGVAVFLVVKKVRPVNN